MPKYTRYLIGIGIAIFLVGGYFVADRLLFNGVRARLVDDEGFQGNYFTKNKDGTSVTIVLIGGGQWGDYWGQQFALRGYNALSLPYVNRDGLPRLPEEINLEYFERALEWLRRQNEVDAEKIVVMGASRNAELALLLAATMPERVGGVVAYAPSAVSWSNTVLPYNSDTVKPSWIYKGKDIPYVPMEKIKGDGSGKIETLTYWKSGLAKTDYVERATIKVEQINGPILLLSGLDDKVWPSAQMADMIVERLKEMGFKYPFESIKYENAGHMISGNPGVASDYRKGTLTIEGSEYEFAFGGTKEGDMRASQAAQKKVFDFLQMLESLTVVE